jgi:hypothetical protein
MVYSKELIAGKKIRRNLQSEGEEFFGSLSMFGMILFAQLCARYIIKHTLSFSRDTFQTYSFNLNHTSLSLTHY